MTGQFEIELRKHLGEEIHRLRLNLENPATVTTFSDYRWLCGQIYALNRAVASFDDINHDINSQ